MDFTNSFIGKPIRFLKPDRLKLLSKVT